MEKKTCLFNIFKIKVNKIFGEEKKGIHSYRICDIAYLDILVTMVAALFIQKAFYTETEYYKILLFLFILGIILHRIFDVKTTIDRLIFN